MKQKALRAGDAHSHEDEECRKRSTLRFGRCLTSATGAQQRARRENVPRHILFLHRKLHFLCRKASGRMHRR